MRRDSATQVHKKTVVTYLRRLAGRASNSEVAGRRGSKSIKKSYLSVNLAAWAKWSFLTGSPREQPHDRAVISRTKTSHNFRITCGISADVRIKSGSVRMIRFSVRSSLFFFGCGVKAGLSG